MLSSLLHSHPVIWLAPLVLLLFLTGLAEFAVEFSAQNQAAAQKDIDSQLAGLAVEGIAQTFRESFWMVLALKVQVMAQPNVPAMLKVFNSSADVLMAQAPSGLPIVLMLLPMGRLTAIYPDYPGAAQILGLDVFTGPASIDPRWMAMDFQRPALEFYFRPGGGVNANMAVPITVADVDPDDLFGMSRDVTFCPSDQGCYNATGRVRFWGLIIAVVTLDDLFSGHASHLRVLSQEGLVYQVLVPASVVSATGLPSTDLVVAHSPRAQVGAEQRADVVTATAMLPTGDAWSLRVWRPRGNTPRWRTPLLAVMPLVCLILAAEVFVVLVSGFRHGQLVRAMLPPRAARCLAVGQEYAEAFDGVTILFTDICSYTTISSELTARQVVALLSGLYDRFDTLCEKHGMWKVETVGDCWMAASGAYPRLAPREAALRAARLALDMIQVAEGFTSEDGRRVQIRVGLASGPVFASVISHKMPHVALIGDTTNVASRMESSCEPMRIHVAGSTAALLRPSCSLPVRLAPCPDAAAFPPPDQPDPWPATPGTSGGQPCGPLPPAGRPGCELASHSSLCVHLELARQVSSSSSSGLGAQLPNPAQGSTVEVADPASGRTLYLEARGPQNIKGKGLMHTFWLSGGPAPPA